MGDQVKDGDLVVLIITPGPVPVLSALAPLGPGGEVGVCPVEQS